MTTLTIERPNTGPRFLPVPSFTEDFTALFKLGGQLPKGESSKVGVSSVRQPFVSPNQEDQWDEPESELTYALQRSLDRNRQDTTLPVALEKLQSKAIRENR